VVGYHTFTPQKKSMGFLSARFVHRLPSLKALILFSRIFGKNATTDKLPRFQAKQTREEIRKPVPLQPIVRINGQP